MSRACITSTSWYLQVDALTLVFASLIESIAGWLVARITACVIELNCAALCPLGYEAGIYKELACSTEYHWSNAMANGAVKTRSHFLGVFFRGSTRYLRVRVAYHKLRCLAAHTLIMITRTRSQAV